MWMILRISPYGRVPVGNNIPHRNLKYFRYLSGTSQPARTLIRLCMTIFCASSGFSSSPGRTRSVSPVGLRGFAICPPLSILFTSSSRVRCGGQTRRPLTESVGQRSIGRSRTPSGCTDSLRNRTPRFQQSAETSFRTLSGSLSGVSWSCPELFWRQPAIYRALDPVYRLASVPRNRASLTPCPEASC
jgi:hypothetical protein